MPVDQLRLGAADGLSGCGQTACRTGGIRCREQSSRENRWFSSGQRPRMDFGHGLLWQHGRAAPRSRPGSVAVGQTATMPTAPTVTEKAAATGTGTAGHHARRSSRNTRGCARIGCASGCRSRGWEKFPPLPAPAHAPPGTRSHPRSLTPARPPPRHCSRHRSERRTRAAEPSRGHQVTTDAQTDNARPDDGPTAGTGTDAGQGRRRWRAALHDDSPGTRDPSNEEQATRLRPSGRNHSTPRRTPLGESARRWPVGRRQTHVRMRAGAVPGHLG